MGHVPCPPATRDDDVSAAADVAVVAGVACWLLVGALPMLLGSGDKAAGVDRLTDYLLCSSRSRHASQRNHVPLPPLAQSF
ncbi:uncharacterized protein UV8b_04174 [Ustilaginoidea virens]|uniref:Uncharacterized protein n=1 Tax=Ustilaginoidea virens TaxID=1159556 RepID=A0A8E5HR37_USTVR|nr:uncharacterized protein UV8b_04174 [Ustilaginoidea virens]QUC19933.1 hypothetical protein UV8b_04174 [Ustilaginoidea virens]